MKTSVLEMLKWWLVGHQLDPDLVSEKIMRERKDDVFVPMLQWFGTNFVREFLGLREFWIDEFFRYADQCGSPIVCDDVRFPNEAEALRDKFIIVRIYRPEKDRLASLGNANYDPNHPSERELEKIIPDYTIFNDGSIDDLALKVKEMIEYYGQYRSGKDSLPDQHRK